MISSWCGRNTWNSGRSARPRRSRPADVLAPVVLLAALGQPAGAQAGYTAAQFDSARFSHAVQSEVQTVLGGRERRERISVAGLLVVTAVADTGSRLRLEAWFDSLDVRRDTPEGSLEPDTDGMIGGRYRGHLTMRGTY